MAGIALAARLEGEAAAFMGMAAKAACCWMVGFGNTAPVMTGPGMADLAEAAPGDGIDKAGNAVGIADCCRG